MKTQDLITMAGAALAVFLLYGYLDKKKNTANGYAVPVTKIMDWGGWQYFSDGTSIGPDGAYYYQDKQVTLGKPNGFTAAAYNGGGGLFSAAI